MTEALLDLPDNLEDGDKLADWAEAIMLLEDREAMTRGELKRRLADKGGDFEVGLLLDRVRTRSRRASSSYPFEIQPDSLVKRAVADAALYEFLLWTSFPQSPIRAAHDYRAIDAFFDRVVLRAMLSYFGSRAGGFRFGTPASGPRPKGFRDALIWLADEMDVESTGSIPANDHKNDAGVDVIVWLPLSDARADFVVAIGQCTLRTDWESKVSELCASAVSWGGGWLALGHQPLTFLAIPFEYSVGADRFDELRQLVHVILDRIRICDLAGGVHPDDRPAIEKWIADQRKRLLDRKPQPKRKAKSGQGSRDKAGRSTTKPSKKGAASAKQSAKPKAKSVASRKASGKKKPS